MNSKSIIILQSHSLNALKVIMILFAIFIHTNPTVERCGEAAMWWHSINVVAVPVFSLSPDISSFIRPKLLEKKLIQKN